MFGVTNADADVVSRDIALLEEVLGTGFEGGRTGSSPVVSAMLVLMGMVLSFLSCRFLLRESRLVLLVDDRVFIEGGACRWWYQPTPWKVFAGLQPSSEVVDLEISQDVGIYHDPRVCCALYASCTHKVGDHEPHVK